MTCGDGVRLGPAGRRDLDCRAIKFLKRFVQKKGSFPADVRAELEKERLVMLAEGIPGFVTHVADGGRARKTATIAAFAISQQRLAIYGLGQPLVDVTWDSGDARELDITAQDDGLRLEFDRERFIGDGPGRVEVLLRIADSPTLLAAIDQRRRPLEPRRRWS